MIDLNKTKTNFRLRQEQLEKKMIKDFEDLTKKYPDASFHKKCLAIAEKYLFTCQAIKVKLGRNGITRETSII